MRAFIFMSLAWLLSLSGFGQDSLPRFDTTDVRPSAHMWNANMQGGLLRDGRYELHQATLLDLIVTAYGVDAERVVGGPPWLDSDRFDVVAKAPPSTSRESARLMLQKLLADRFKLALREDKRSLTAYVLTVGKGKLKLKEAEDSNGTGCQGQPPSKPEPNTIPYMTATCRGITMEAFARALRELSAEYITHPVIDQTGLTGAWDLDLRWTPKGPFAAGRGGISLPDAIEKQLGLRLQAQRVLLPVLIVDSVSRKPAGNSSAGKGSSMEFEVAAIKPSPPGTEPTPPHLRQILPGGRLYWRGVPLRDLITQAWDLDPDPHASITGAPKWLDSARFDLVAKAPVANGGQLFSEDLRAMMRALLVDRFKMTTHYEDRPVEVYTLVAAKPKLKKADTENRPGCRIERPQPPSDPGTGPPPEVVICQNMTMTEFASRLQGLARSYIRYPVENATGIGGTWDFTLRFNPAPPPEGGPGRGMPKGGPPPGDPLGPVAGPASDDLVGRITLFVAIEKELGLKLEMHKRSMPVLVIDHIEKQPTEN